MTTFASDAFTGTEDTTLSTYDASWSKITGATGSAEIASNRLRGSDTLVTAYYHSATPPSADYPVQATFHAISVAAGGNAGVIGRASSSANTYYYARLNGTSGWQLFKRVAGTATQLGSSVAQTLTAGQSYAVELRMTGTTIELYKLGESTAAVSVTDSAITAAGFAGLYFFSNVVPSDITNFHIDDWSAGTVGGGTASVLPSGIASAEAFGSATATRISVQTVAPSGISSVEAFGTASVTRTSVQTVAATGIASAETFGSHTVVPGGVVVPQGIPSAEAFGTATLARTSVQSVSATGIASGEAFGSAVVTRTSAQSIVVSGIASGEAFGTAAFTRTSLGVVAPQGIASAEAFGTATFTRISVKIVTTTGIPSSEAFGTSVVSIPGTRTLTAQDLADIANAVWAHPKALTVAKFLGLK